MSYEGLKLRLLIMMVRLWGRALTGGVPRWGQVGSTSRRVDLSHLCAPLGPYPCSCLSCAPRLLQLAFGFALN